MKKIIVILSLLGFSLVGTSQELIDIYQKGLVKLIPDAEYAMGNNWDKVFETYYDTIYGQPMGKRKSIIVMPDGSVVVNHRYRNYYSKFNPRGKFVKEFGIVKSNGQQFKETDEILGIIDNKTFFTNADNMGNILCFDFEGNYKKTLNLDYMVQAAISLPNGKIAVVGWVLWETKIREFVAIVDYETNEEKIIWDHFSTRDFQITDTRQRNIFNYYYEFEKGGIIAISSMPYARGSGTRSTPEIRLLNDRIVLAIPETGEIIGFNLEGKKVFEDKIEWATNYISVEEQKEIQQKMINKYKNLKDPTFYSYASQEENKKAQESLIKQMEDDLGKIVDPIPIPVFSTIIKDSDNNLLFFEFPKEDGANKFNVWILNGNGKFECQSSFVCDDYDLTIKPSKMVFHNGYIFALQTLKNASGNPLRLVRFKLTSE